MGVVFGEYKMRIKLIHRWEWPGPWLRAANKFWRTKVLRIRYGAPDNPVIGIAPPRGYVFKRIGNVLEMERDS